MAPPRWFFEKYSPKQLAEFIQSCNLRRDQKALLLDSKRWERSDKGIFVSPPPDVVLELSRPARERIYRALAESEVNSAQRDPFRFRSETFEQWASAIGLEEEQLETLRRLTYMQGGSLCFCDGPILQRLFSPAAFKRLVKALYGERTFLMRLIINSETDIDSLIIELRGQKVIMDAGLASIYGVDTRVLNQAVKRNVERFPADFMFQLAPEETERGLRSRSQIVILNRGQNIKYLPYGLYGARRVDGC